MKKRLSTLFIFLVAFSAFVCQNSYGAGNQNNDKLTTIDANDTVIFDLSKAVIAGNKVSFPVSFKSDDVINALDFSLKFNLSNFVFDTIINLTGYIQPTSNYNVPSQTLYFSSYSGSQYHNDTPLVSVRFTMLGGPLCSTDLNSVSVYLNGSPCTAKVINCVATDVPAVRPADLVNAYPSPANEILNVETPEHSTIQLSDLNGREIMIDRSALEKHSLDIQNIAAGIYVLKIYTESFVVAKKIVIY